MGTGLPDGSGGQATIDTDDLAGDFGGTGAAQEKYYGGDVRRAWQAEPRALARRIRPTAVRHIGIENGCVLDKGGGDTVDAYTVPGRFQGEIAHKANDATERAAYQGLPRRCETAGVRCETDNGASLFCQVRKCEKAQLLETPQDQRGMSTEAGGIRLGKDAADARCAGNGAMNDCIEPSTRPGDLGHHGLDGAGFPEITGRSNQLRVIDPPFQSFLGVTHAFPGGAMYGDYRASGSRLRSDFKPYGASRSGYQNHISRR